MCMTASRRDKETSEGGGKGDGGQRAAQDSGGDGDGTVVRVAEVPRYIRILLFTVILVPT